MDEFHDDLGSVCIGSELPVVGSSRLFPEPDISRISVRRPVIVARGMVASRPLGDVVPVVAAISR